jgi:hypothetical protein
LQRFESLRQAKGLIGLIASLQGNQREAEGVRGDYLGLLGEFLVIDSRYVGKDPSSDLSGMRLF